MRGLKRSPWLFSLGVLLAVLALYRGFARADVTSDRPGSIVVYPKVISDGVRDTLIQITNTGNMPVNAHCFYINTNADVPGVCSLTFSTPCTVDAQCPDGETCVHCGETDFDIFLTSQQPTFWGVSAGRRVNLTDNVRGFDPGPIPGRGTDFVGELKCIATTAPSATTPGQPIMQNVLKGEATIIPVGGGADVSEYNAFTIQATGGATGNDLALGTTYNACPASLVVDHRADGAVDTFTGLPVTSELTLVPCTEDLENQLPTRAILNLVVVNEFEQPLSASLNFNCMLNQPLSSISSNFSRGVLGSDFAKTRITPSTSSICYSGTNRNRICSTDADCPGFVTTTSGTKLGCRPVTGLLGVIEEFQSAKAGTGSAAVTAHLEGNRPGDVIILPPTQ
jgi:hypothetical protein